ncbi:MAG TPA: hypothetical protein VHJ40_02840 [Actinomycetota bacterium]|nr:hypothetical protein [Actinomycetota bacterium]
MRVTKFVALFLAVFALSSAVHFGARSQGASFDAAGIVSTLVLLMAITFIGTKVSYRWRDLGLLLIPVVGLYFWLMWIWRLASLPDRYWERSPEDTARLRAAKDREIQADLSLRQYWEEEVSRERKRRIHIALLTGRRLENREDAALGAWLAGKRKQGLLFNAAISAIVGASTLLLLWKEAPATPSATYRLWIGLAFVWAFVNPILSLWFRQRALRAERLNERVILPDYR